MLFDRYVNDQNLVELNLIDSNSNTSRKQITLEVLNCGLFKSCLRCSKYAHACNWCSNRCLSLVDHTCDRNETCEMFDVGSSKVLVPHTLNKRLQAPIPINTRNMVDLNNIRCLISPNISLTFKLVNQTHGLCQLDNIFDRLINEKLFGTGEYKTQLRLYNHMSDYYIDTTNLEIVFYSCEYLASDCNGCSNLESILSCNCKNSTTNYIVKTLVQSRPAIKNFTQKLN